MTTGSISIDFACVLLVFYYLQQEHRSRQRNTMATAFQDQNHTPRYIVCTTIANSMAQDSTSAQYNIRSKVHMMLFCDFERNRHLMIVTCPIWRQVSISFFFKQTKRVPFFFLSHFAVVGTAAFL